MGGRVGGGWELGLGGEGWAWVLMFGVVIFIEALQRVLGRRLQETAHREMDRVQRLTAEIQQEARQGNLKDLVNFIQRRAREGFELPAGPLTLLDPRKTEPASPMGKPRAPPAPQFPANPRPVSPHRHR